MIRGWWQLELNTSTSATGQPGSLNTLVLWLVPCILCLLFRVTQQYTLSKQHITTWIGQEKLQAFFLVKSCCQEKKKTWALLYVTQRVVFSMAGGLFTEGWCNTGHGHKGNKKALPFLSHYSKARGFRVVLNINWFLSYLYHHPKLSKKINFPFSGPCFSKIIRKNTNNFTDLHCKGFKHYFPCLFNEP